MKPPLLSPKQMAYLFAKEAFLDRLCQRAQRLADDGYSVRGTETPAVFLILCPARVNTYRVNMLEKTCDCAFFQAQLHDEPLTSDGTLVPCKHLLGLKTLLRKTRERLLKEGAMCEAYRLWAQTMACLALERLQQEDEALPTPLAVLTTMKGEVRDELSRYSGPRARR